MARHSFHAPSFVAGLLFVGLGLAFLADLVGAITVDVGWLWPILLIGLGIAGLVSRPRHHERQAP